MVRDQHVEEGQAHNVEASITMRIAICDCAGCRRRSRADGRSEREG